MKRKSTWRLFFAFLMLSILTACNQTNASSSSLSQISNSNGSSSTPVIEQPDIIQDWKETDKQLMLEILNEVIPVAPLTSNYVCLEDEDEYGPYLYIYDEASADISEDYIDILTNEGYLYDSYSDGYYFYYKEVSDSSLLILQFGFYLGDSEYPQSMDLFAWLEVNPSSLETISDWEQELKDMMQEVLSIQLPVAPITNQYDYMNYEDEVGDDIVYIYDLYVDDICEAYGTILQQNGYILEEGTTEDGYFIYSFTNQDTQIYVQIDYLYGFEIFAWKNQSFVGTLTSWPTQEIQEALKGLNLTIPAYTDAELYQFELYDASSYSLMISVCQVNQEAVSTYKQILQDAQWTIIQESEEGNEALDPSLQYVLEYWYDETSQTLYIYFDTYGSVPVLAWPEQQLNQFLQLDNVVIPIYESSSYLIENQVQSFIIYAAASTIESENAYLQTLTQNQWTIDSSQYDTIGHIAIDATNQVQITFYFSNEYLIITVEKIVEVQETLTILPTDFSSQSYAANEGEKTIQNLSFSCHNIMDQQNKIQIRRDDSCFYNNDALNLVTLQLENLSGSPTVYGCLEAGDYANGTIISPDENGIYHLNNYKYFCIIGGTSVTTVSAIIIELA